MIPPAIPQLLAAYRRLNYVVFDSGPHDLNIFGIRSRGRDQSGDAFDDLIGFFRFVHGQPVALFFPATTDPGLSALRDPSFPEAIRNGTAILKEGQYRSAYRIGLHGMGKWRHQALVQVRPVTIYRDANRDAVLNTEGVPESMGLFGINIHAASLWNDVARIGNYSSGCQVLQKSRDLRRLIEACGLQVNAGLGSLFTYTLLNEEQL